MHGAFGGADCRMSVAHGASPSEDRLMGVKNRDYRHVDRWMSVARRAFGLKIESDPRGVSPVRVRAGTASSHMADYLFLDPRLHTSMAQSSHLAQQALTQVQLDNVERVLQPMVVGQGATQPAQRHPPGRPGPDACPRRCEPANAHLSMACPAIHANAVPLPIGKGPIPSGGPSSGRAWLS